MGTTSVPAKSKKVATQKLIEFDSLSDIPTFGSEAEEADWWGTHAPSKKFFENTPMLEDDPLLPPPRAASGPVSVRFDANTVSRLRVLARKKGKRYQTLLKEFVTERLYEEEKREGIIPS